MNLPGSPAILLKLSVIIMNERSDSKKLVEYIGISGVTGFSCVTEECPLGLSRCKHEANFPVDKCPLAAASCCKGLKNGNTAEKRILRASHAAYGGKPVRLTRKIKSARSDIVEAYTDIAKKTVKNADELIIFSRGGSVFAVAPGSDRSEGIYCTVCSDKNTGDGETPVVITGMYAGEGFDAADWFFFSLMKKYTGEGSDDGREKVYGITSIPAFLSVYYWADMKAEIKAAAEYAAAMRHIFVLKKAGVDKIKYPVIRMTGAYCYQRLCENTSGRNGKDLSDTGLFKYLVMLKYSSSAFGLDIDPDAAGGTASYDADKLESFLALFDRSDETKARLEGYIVSSLISIASFLDKAAAEEKLNASSGNRVRTDILYFSTVYSLFTAVAAADVIRTLFYESSENHENLMLFYKTLSEKKEADGWMLFFDEKFNMKAAVRSLGLLERLQ